MLQKPSFQVYEKKCLLLGNYCVCLKLKVTSESGREDKTELRCARSEHNVYWHRKAQLTSSNSGPVSCAPYCFNGFGKGMNPLIVLLAMF